MSIFAEPLRLSRPRGSGISGAGSGSGWCAGIPPTAMEKARALHEWALLRLIRPNLACHAILLGSESVKGSVSAPS
jgi:hypothetical protein